MRKVAGASSGCGTASPSHAAAAALLQHRPPASGGGAHTAISMRGSDQRAAPAAGSGAGLSHGAATVAACLGWAASSSAIILVNKHIMSGLEFPYPVAVAALGMLGTTVASAVYCRVLRLVPVQQQVSMHTFLTAVVPIGLFMSVSFASGNTAYLYLSVAFVQMLKAFTPVATMLFAFMFGLEQPTMRLIAAVCVITLGVAGSSYGEGNFSWLGVAAMLTSITAEALRLVLMQRLMSGFKLHPIEGLLYLGPAVSAFLVVHSAVFEGPDMLATGALARPFAHPLPFIASACSGFAVNALAMCVISLASALTLKVLGICKDVALVLVGVALLGEAVTQVQLAGYCVSLSGFVWYNYLKFVAPTAAAGAGLGLPAAKGAAPAATEESVPLKEGGGGGGAGVAGTVRLRPMGRSGAGGSNAGSSASSPGPGTPVGSRAAGPGGEAAAGGEGARLLRGTAASCLGAPS